MRSVLPLVVIALCAGCQSEPSADAPAMADPVVPLLETVPARPLASLLSGEVVLYLGGCFYSDSWSAGVEIEGKILINPAESCALEAAQAEGVIELNETASLAALHDDFLFLDSGTGPDARTLQVLALPEGTNVYSGPYLHDYLSVSEGILRFLAPAADTDRMTCAGTQDFEQLGLTAGFERVMLLDLDSGDLTVTEEVTCSPRQ